MHYFFLYIKKSSETNLTIYLCNFLRGIIRDVTVHKNHDSVCFQCTLFKRNKYKLIFFIRIEQKYSTEFHPFNF